VGLVALLLLVAMLASLGAALLFLLRPRGDSRRMARALTLRVALSVLFFLLLLLGWYTGVLAPHGLGE
jgi:cytochrome bd-type quinol oxidase subunit 2